MTTLVELQGHLKATKRYAGDVDGLWGRLTEAGILLMLTDGPDTRLTEQDIADSAGRLGVPVAAVKAVLEVESAGAGFIGGRPTILTEPHVFSRLTKHRFDGKFPTISYPKWGMRPYPKTQDQRYALLLQMIRRDIDAGFASASYGKFQIMGFNYEVCGYPTSWEFAEAMGRDERTQLFAFERFLADAGLIAPLRARQWAVFASGYNGEGYRRNNYDGKLAQAYAAAGGR